MSRHAEVNKCIKGQVENNKPLKQVLVCLNMKEIGFSGGGELHLEI
jgi:hypothetical protein